MTAHRLARARLLAWGIALALLPSISAFSPHLPALPELSPRALELIGERRCHCGCGNHLPGSPHEPSCFGCSVGKTDVSYVLEALQADVDPLDILLRLDEPVLVDVHADYTTPGLYATWQRAERAASSYGQHRVVLRAPGRSPAARLAVKLAECARLQNRHARVHRALIAHNGPWSEKWVLDLGERWGLDRATTAHCLARIDVAQQLAKDREHATERGVRTYPAIAVNRRLVADAPAELDAAIRAVVMEGSL